MPRLIEFFPIVESLTGSAPHAELDVVCDLAEAGDHRWNDLWRELKDWVVNDVQKDRVYPNLDKIDSINQESEWRMDVHNQFRNAVAYANMGQLHATGANYLPNVEDILRSRALRHQTEKGY